MAFMHVGPSVFIILDLLVPFFEDGRKIQGVGWDFELPWSDLSWFLVLVCLC